MNARTGTVAILISLGLAAALPAQGKDVVIGVLKGPTGIGLCRLLQAPPVLPSGKKATVVMVPSVDIMLSKISTGEVDIAALPSSTAAKIHSGGLGYSLAAVIGGGMMSFITSDPSIASPADLRGKKIHASGQGAVPQFVLETILSHAGLDPATEVEISYALPYPEAAASLIAGRIDSAYLPEPFATMALSGNKALRSPFDIQALYAKAGGTADYPLSVLSIKDSFLASDRATATFILERAQASIEWTKAHPADAAVLAERLGFGIKEAVAKASIPRTNYLFLRAKEARGQLETLFSFILKTAPAAIGGKLPPAAFYAY